MYLGRATQRHRRRSLFVFPPLSTQKEPSAAAPHGFTLLPAPVFLDLSLDLDISRVSDVDPSSSPGSVLYGLFNANHVWWPASHRVSGRGRTPLGCRQRADR